MHRVIVLSGADADMQAAVDWWKENRSIEQAEKWYLEILEAIEGLSEMPRRFAIAPESGSLDRPVHEMPFGVSARPTHRVLYTVEGDLVKVLRVLHGAQDDFDIDELA